MKSLAALSLFLFLAALSQAETVLWSQFRGVRYDNNFPGQRPPAEFGPDKNLKWKVEAPSGHSSLVAAGDRLLFTGFDGEALQITALARADGSVLWKKTLKPEKLEAFVPNLGSPAASSCATDGERIVSYFGSVGLLCHDLEGNELWTLPMPLPVSQDGFGSGSSPIIHDGVAYLLRDEEGPGQGLYAVDIKSGKELWKRKRDGFRISFGSPVIWDGCVVAIGDLRIKSYDLKTGADRWLLRGTAACPCTTPAPGPDGNLYIATWSNGSGNEPNIPPWEKLTEMLDKDKDGKLSPKDCEGTIFGDLFVSNDHDRNGFIEAHEWSSILKRMFAGRNVVLALKPGGRGDITDTHVVWQNDKGAPYVASPLLYDGRLYLMKDGGLLTVYESATGKLLTDRMRVGVGGDFYASPIAADGRIFAASKSGTLVSLKAGDQPEVLSKVDFGEPLTATPIILEDTLYVRTQGHVWAFARQ